MKAKACEASLCAGADNFPVVLNLLLGGGVWKVKCHAMVGDTAGSPTGAIESLSVCALGEQFGGGTVLGGAVLDHDSVPYAICTTGASEVVVCTECDCLQARRL